MKTSAEFLARLYDAERNQAGDRPGTAAVGEIARAVDVHKQAALPRPVDSLRTLTDAVTIVKGPAGVLAKIWTSAAASDQELS
jgi:hypothetical protein